MEREQLIIGLSSKERLIQQIEANMKIGDLVMATDVLISGEVHLALMTSNKLGENLVLSAGPTFLIDGGGYWPTPLCWDEKPILLKDYTYVMADRVKVKEVVVVGNDSVFEFFSKYCRHYDVLKSQTSVLRVATQLGIQEGRFLREIQLSVAQDLVTRLVNQFPKESESLSLQLHQSDLTGDFAYIAQEVSDETIDEFANLLEASGRNSEIKRILKTLVDTGIYGLGLKVTIKRKGGKEQIIDVDQSFEGLANHYQPNLVPTEIPRAK
jgi:hypothetical protein